MSLSYSAITNHGKVTLPSIESWNSNMNILKDPPKSLFTRRIDKVGETSDITSMLDDAGDRSCEAILQFSRGINPSVSVSYNNNTKANGNNGLSGNAQAFLPYRIARDGAFRAPVVSQYDLLPLSRQPRVWTSSFTNKEFPDYSKKAMIPMGADKTKEVKNSLLNVSARPTAVYKIERPQESTYDVKNAIQKMINVSASSGFRTMDLTNQHVSEPTKEINKDLNHAFAQSNLRDSRYINNNVFNPDRYIQDTNAHSVDTIKGASYIQAGPLDDYIDMGEVKVRESALNVNYNTALSGNEKVDYIHGDLFQQRNLPYYTAESNISGETTNKVTYIHDDIMLDRSIPQYQTDSNLSGNDKISYIHEDVQLLRNLPEYSLDSGVRGNDKVTYIHNDVELDRRLPEYSANTNQTQSNLQKINHHDYIKQMHGAVPTIKDVYVNKAGQGESNVSSTTYYLDDKIQPGGYNIPAVMPMQNRPTNIKENFETDKAKMDRMVIDQHMGRFESYAPFDKRFRQ
jgi:hypothetical protein